MWGLCRHAIKVFGMLRNHTHAYTSNTRCFSCIPRVTPKNCVGYRGTCPSTISISLKGGYWNAPYTFPACFFLWCGHWNVYCTLISWNSYPVYFLFWGNHSSLTTTPKVPVSTLTLQYIHVGDQPSDCGVLFSSWSSVSSVEHKNGKNNNLEATSPNPHTTTLQRLHQTTSHTVIGSIPWAMPWTEEWLSDL